MPTTLADAYLRLRPDTRTLGPELTRDAERAAGDAGTAAGRSFGSRMKSAALAVASGAALVGGIVAVGAKEAIESARDLKETQSKVDVVFGKSAANVKQWAASMANDFGQSQKSALDGAATFAIYGKAAGKTGASLFNFSTDLTTLASDMASFSNTSPEEAIEAIGAAMRGESDPIEKYGVLLNETVLKNVALKKGIIDTTKGALTPQQRVLAVQAALFEQLGTKGSKTIGDFERTSKGLANQQRILRANLENTKATIGQALLPVATQFVTMLNQQAIPALHELWATHGPAITKFLQDFTVDMGQWMDTAKDVDWGGMFRDARAALVDLGPAVKDARAEMPNLGNAFRVAGTAIDFLAKHSDTLAKAMPYLVAGLIALKVATLASNIATAASPVFRILEYKATQKQTQAIVANTVARAAETAATGTGTAATVGATAAENASTTAKRRGILATLASVPAMAKARVATIAATIAQWAHNTAWLAFPLTWIIVAIVAVVAAIVILWKKNEGFRNLVKTVWAAIQVAIGAVKDWFVNTVWPSLRKAFDQLMTVVRTLWTVYSTVWKGIWTVISTYYGFMYNKVFMPLVRLITTTLPNAFKAGVGFIGKWWQGLQAVARRPVDFVVNTVINKGIIGSLNWLASKVGVKDRIPAFSFGDGPGMSAPRTPAGRDNADHLGDGYGTGDGLGLIDAIRSPAKWLAGKAGLNGVVSKFGNNPLTQAITGAGRTAVGWGVSRVKALLGELFTSGGGVGTNGLQAGISGVLGSLRGAFGNVPVISGLRPGSTTLSGRTSYHASGRAVDIAPVRAWAEYLRSVWGSRLRELITPWRDINMLNGRPHRYSYAIEAQHGVYGSNAHIHAAMDRGGFLVPGWNEPIYNGTGRLEPVTPASTMDEVVAALMAILAVLERLAPELARELRGTTRGAMTLARGMV